jgi:hypothetical protein
MQNDILNAFQSLVDRWYSRYAEAWIVNVVRGVYDPPRAIVPNLPWERADAEQILREFEALLSRFDRAEALDAIRSSYDPLYREPLSEHARNRRFNRYRKEHERGLGTNLWPLVNAALSQRD